MLANLTNRVRRRLTRTPNSVIIIGIGYPSHRLAEHLISNRLAVPIAFIDDEPWNHRTRMHSAPVHYPSELLALCRKHRVQLVVGFEGEPLQLDSQTLAQLEFNKIRYLSLDPGTSVAQQQQRLLGSLRTTP